MLRPRVRIRVATYGSHLFYAAAIASHLLTKDLLMHSRKLLLGQTRRLSSKRIREIRRQPGLERLEDRSLLTAVGFFERVDGVIGDSDVVAISVATASAGDDSDPNPGSPPLPPGPVSIGDEMLANAVANHEILLENVHSQGTAHSLAEIVTPIGGTTTAPTVSMAAVQLTSSFADGDDDYAAEARSLANSFTSLRGDFIYSDTTPGADQDFVGAIFLNASGGGSRIGSDTTPNQFATWSQSVTMNIVVWKNQTEVIADIWVTGGRDWQVPPEANAMIYTVTGQANGTTIDATTSSVNALIRFSTPIVDGDRITFTTQVDINNLQNQIDVGIGADSYSWARDWDDNAIKFAGTDFVQALSAYGYATPTGMAVVPGLVQLPDAPGDINGDGEIDDDDAELWNDILANWAEGGPAPLIVTTEVDEFDGDYSFGDLSLREAIYLADQVDRPGEDVIVFAPWVKEIELDGSELLVSGGNDLIIAGPGASELAIDAVGLSRVIQVAGGANVSLRGLTITGGYFNSNGGGGIYNNTSTVDLTGVAVVGNSGYSKGGGIFSTGTLQVRSSTISDNLSSYGGGIYQSGGSLLVRDSIIESNDAGSGGGIYVAGPSIEIVSSYIGDNDAISGGGIFLLGGHGEIRDSTFAYNSADHNGGGLYLYPADSDDLAIVNSTVSTNEAGQAGGGVFLYAYHRGPRSQATLVMANSTIAENTVVGVGPGIAVSAAGLYVSSNAGDVFLLNTILAENYTLGTANNIHGPISTAGSYNNLIGFGGSGGFSNGVQGNIVLSTGQTAGLTALGNYGGPAWLLTHALLSTSAAIDAGDNAIASLYGLDFDQRGDGYDRIVDWDGDTILKSDIGAFELALGELYT